jgi:hypothetical protein
MSLVLCTLTPSTLVQMRYVHFCFLSTPYP